MSDQLTGVEVVDDVIDYTWIDFRLNLHFTQLFPVMASVGG